MYRQHAQQFVEEEDSSSDEEPNGVKEDKSNVTNQPEPAKQAPKPHSQRPQPPQLQQPLQEQPQTQPQSQEHLQQSQEQSQSQQPQVPQQPQAPQQPQEQSQQPQGQSQQPQSQQKGRNFDVSITPEERKRLKQKQKKKNQRKRKRQEATGGEIDHKDNNGTKDTQIEEEDDDDDEDDNEPSASMTVSDALKFLKDSGVEPPKKRVFGVAIDPSEYPKHEDVQTYDPVTNNFTRASTEKPEIEDEEAAKPKKQHKGLRCIKCFALLCRDADFEYVNGQLWVNSDELRKQGWQGLETRGSWVYCQNMHVVGSKKATTWTNKSKITVVLKVEKTTFMENFVNNPKFVGSDKIINKMQTVEKTNDGMWRQLSLPDKKYIPQTPAPADRYH